MSTGAVVWQASMRYAPAIVGCVGGLLCCLLLRSVLMAWPKRRAESTGLELIWPRRRVLLILLYLVLLLTWLKFSFFGGWEDAIWEDEIVSRAGDAQTTYRRRRGSITMTSFILSLSVSFLLIWILCKQLESHGGLTRWWLSLFSRDNCPLPFTVPALKEAPASTGHARAAGSGIQESAGPKSPQAQAVGSRYLSPTRITRPSCDLRVVAASKVPPPRRLPLEHAHDMVSAAMMSAAAMGGPDWSTSAVGGASASAAAHTAPLEEAAARAAASLIAEEAAEGEAKAAKAAKAAKMAKMAKEARALRTKEARRSTDFSAMRASVDAEEVTARYPVADKSMVDEKGSHEGLSPPLSKLPPGGGPGLGLAASVQAAYGWRCELIGSAHFFVGRDVDLVIEVPCQSLRDAYEVVVRATGWSVVGTVSSYGQRVVSLRGVWEGFTIDAQVWRGGGLADTPAEHKTQQALRCTSRLVDGTCARCRESIVLLHRWAEIWGCKENQLGQPPGIAWTIIATMLWQHVTNWDVRPESSRLEALLQAMAIMWQPCSNRVAIM
jgi:hypothetical protein